MQSTVMYGCLAAFYATLAGQSFAEDFDVSGDVDGASGPAEVVSVQYGDEIDLAPLSCSAVKGRRISRVCYDAANRYLLIREGQSYRQFCEVDAAITDRFLSSPAMDRFFRSMIEGKYDCRPGNMPKYEPVPQAVLIDLGDFRRVR